MAAVEGNDDFALTKAQLDRQWGGGGRGDHGEATDELGNAFSRWRARTKTATRGRQWRSCCSVAAELRRAEEMEMGLVCWLTGALGELKSWPAVPRHLRHVVA